jgi:L-lactate dehydrogenase (cytochrome)
MPHFENSSATRGVPIFSSAAVREFGSRDTLSWVHVEQIRRMWKGKLVLKGILSTEDARIAADRGVDGVIVSSHGGRQLDASIAPLHALPAIARAKGAMKVMIDSGIRRGNDVLKAIALGADFVFIGRPFIYAASIGGQAGVAHAIRLLAHEIQQDMALIGVSSLRELGPSALSACPSHSLTNL